MDLLEALELEFPLVGFYDAPDPSLFEPLVAPPAQGHACLFAYFLIWKQGKTLHLTREAFGCGGAGRWLCGVETRTREEFIAFLADDEGLKADRELMGRWIDAGHPYRAQHEHLLIGPLRAGQEAFLKTVTFFVNLDQLSILMLGANYHAAPEDPPPVVAPFGAGCMELLPLLRNLELPQAILGATDLAMRHLLPPDILAFTCTVPMYQRLCSLDERSFLSRPFLARLKKVRKGI